MAVDDLTLDLLRLHSSTLGVDEEGLRRIAEHATVENVSAGAVLHHAGQTVTDLLLVVRGRLKLALPDPDGHRQTILYLGRDDQFGLLSIPHEIEVPVELVAETDSQVLRILVANARQLAVDVPLWKRNLFKSFGGSLRNTLLNGRPRLRPRIVAFLRISSRTQTVVESLVERLQTLNETVAVFTDNPTAFDGIAGPVHSLIDEHGDLRGVDDIRRRVSNARENDRVVFDIEMERAQPLLPTICGACDRVYWFVTSEEADSTRRQIKELGERSPGVVRNQRWVWCLKADETVAPFVPDLAEIAGHDLKLHLPSDKGSPSQLSKQGLTRLVHDLRGFRVGIALGGGAARGMAHLGVLRALDKAGIVVDEISGTSAGAMAGIVYAAGIAPGYAAECFARDLTPTRWEQSIPGGQSLYLIRKYRGHEWDQMLRTYLHHWRLEQLPIPASSVAVDLVSARQVTSDRGDAVQAILDSINLPGLSLPICRDGMALVDGSVLNVLPADVLVNAGTDFVIAVDVSSHLSKEFAGNRHDTTTSQMQVPNSFETVMRVMNVQNRNVSAIGAQTADITIEPDVSRFSVSDFQKAVEIAAAGEAAAEAVISDIQQQLRQLDVSQP